MPSLNRTTEALRRLELRRLSIERLVLEDLEREVDENETSADVVHIDHVPGPDPAGTSASTPFFVAFFH